MRVTRLSVTPVKGLGLHHPSQVEVELTGVVGDRIFYLVDDTDALFSIAKTGALVGLLAEYDATTDVLTLSRGAEVLAQAAVAQGAPHSANFFAFKQVPGRLAPGPWDEVFSSLAGRSLRLVRADDTGHDVEPLTLLGVASTSRLSEEAGVADVDSRRFRMLVEFDGAAAHAEDRWTGQHLQIGSVVIQVGGPVQRCAGTTRNPESGAVDLKTLGLIGGYRGRQESIFGRGFNFGVYATVVTPGTISLGDSLELLPD